MGTALGVATHSSKFISRPSPFWNIVCNNFLSNKENAVLREMATAQPGAVIRRLHCSICKDIFNEPKLLECLHSFCKKCLIEYHRSDVNTLSCPVCGVETILPPLGIGGLQTNYPIVALIAEITMQNKWTGCDTLNLTCEICEEDSKATHRCIDCTQDICSACLKKHKRFTATREHFTASYKDIRQEKSDVIIQPNKHKCNRHEGKVKLLYCITCEELICTDCTVLDHCKPQHNVADYKVAAAQQRDGLDEMLPYLNQMVMNLSKSVENTSAVRRKLDQNISKAIKQVNEETDKAIANITDNQKRLR